jgi:hypothetical protein
MVGQPMMMGRPMNGPGQTPGAMDAPSPAFTAQSPRNTPMNGIPGQTMQRHQSKSGHGDMPPPQSPAAVTLGRSTPQAGKMNMTPKTKEDLIESATPKSVRNSPNNGVVGIGETPGVQVGGVTSSPPSALQMGGGGGQNQNQNVGGGGNQNNPGPILNGLLPDTSVTGPGGNGPSGNVAPGATEMDVLFPGLLDPGQDWDSLLFLNMDENSGGELNMV